MRKLLVTGGTVFVSRFVADYFARKGDDVYVLNRNTKPQLPNATLIEGDRNDLGDKLKSYTFDAVLDITAYTRQDVENLVNALGQFRDYIMVSSSAVYPETNPCPLLKNKNAALTPFGVTMERTSWLRNVICGDLCRMPILSVRPTSMAPCRMCTGSRLFLNARKLDGSSAFPAEEI